MMIKEIVFAIGAMLVAGSLMAGPSSAQGRGPNWSGNLWEPGEAGQWDPEGMGRGKRHRMMRHWTFMNQEIPDTYLTATNDVGYTTHAILQGGEVYASNCARCHGKKGRGDGEDARDMTPSPALLAFLIRHPIAVDQYLLWTISEGGQKFGSQMPAFKDTLTDEEIWQVIAYMRAGFPAIERADTAQSREAGDSDTDEKKDDGASGGR